MKVLVLGANGFIGSNIVRSFSKRHTVFAATKYGKSGLKIDLLDKKDIQSTLREKLPDVIINCAGVVEDSDKAELNAVFTTNLLEGVKACGLNPMKIIISGSAAEYGIVKPKDIPVTEDVPLNPVSKYGRSKLKETQIALEYRQKHDLPIVIARIFNPIGPDMHTRFLVPRLLQQLEYFRAGDAEVVEISRLDAKRDYINVKDIARALKAIVEGMPSHGVYNIGSGRATSNQELLELMIQELKLKERPKIIETATEPEPMFAVQADISRISHDLDWRPEFTIKETIKEIVNAKR